MVFLLYNSLNELIQYFRTFSPLAWTEHPNWSLRLVFFCTSLFSQNAARLIFHERTPLNVYLCNDLSTWSLLSPK